MNEDYSIENPKVLLKQKIEAFHLLFGVTPQIQFAGDLMTMKIDFGENRGFSLNSKETSDEDQLRCFEAMMRGVKRQMLK